MNLKYHLFSGNSGLVKEDLKLKNKVFVTWKEFWQQVYKDQNSSFEVKADDFIRQDIIGVIFDGERVAASHMYSFFNLKALADSEIHYFNFFSKFYLETLQQNKVETVMSMEYLTVTPDYRKSVVGFSLGSVVASLGTHVFGEIGVDAIVAPARTDVGVHKMAHDIGFVSIEKNTDQRGFNCDLIACFRGDQKPSDSPIVRNLVNQLWTERIVHYSALGMLSQNSVKKVA
jgi:hypothetical protein